MAICLVLVLLLMVGCKKEEPAADPAGTAAPTAAPADQPLEGPLPSLLLTDMAGNQAALISKPKTVISLSPAVTEILYALNCGAALIGADAGSDYPAEAAALQRYSAEDVDAIIAAKPESVLVGQDFPKSALDRLNAAGVCVAVAEASSYADINSSIGFVAMIMEADASSVIDSMQEVLREVEANEFDFEPVNVVLALSDGADGVYRVAGPDSLFNQVIALLYSSSITAADGMGDTVTPAQLAEINPQVVLVASSLDFEKVIVTEAYKSLDAVNDDRAFSIDAALINRPGPRVANGLAALYDILEQASLS